MAGGNQWWTDSNPNPPSPPPALYVLNPILAPPTLPPTKVPPTAWPTATIAGSLTQPYRFPLPMNPLVANMGPQVAPMKFPTPPTITTTSPLPNATHAVAYTQTFAATGGVTAYTWAATNLPAGLTMSTAGVLSGTVAAAGGPYKISVTVTGADLGAGPPQIFSLTVV